MAAWIWFTHAVLTYHAATQGPGRSWEIAFQRGWASLRMMVPGHAHVGPAWSPPGGFEPTIFGLKVRRRFHDAKGAAMLEWL